MKRNPSMGVAMPQEVKELLEALAEEATDKLLQQRSLRKVFASDIVREAIEEYLTKRGHNVEVSVDRGGYRIRRED